MRTSIALGLVLLALGCAKGGGEPAAETPVTVTTPAADEGPPVTVRKELVRTDPLPANRRELIREAMAGHGRHIEGLQWSALMLDYEATGILAGWVANDQQRLMRPAEGAEDPAGVPPDYYALQDQMLESARGLAQAAATHDDEAIATHYAGLTGTCIRCHSLYLRLPGEAAASAP